jgi:hypothetical protein
MSSRNTLQGFKVELLGFWVLETYLGRHMRLRLYDFQEDAPIKLAHSNLDPLTLLLFSSEVNSLIFFRGPFFNPVKIGRKMVI